MRTILRLIAVLGLIFTLMPAILHFSGLISWTQHAWIMLIGMILWFSFAPSAFKKNN